MRKRNWHQLTASELQNPPSPQTKTAVLTITPTLTTIITITTSTTAIGYRRRRNYNGKNCRSHRKNENSSSSSSNNIITSSPVSRGSRNAQSEPGRSGRAVVRRRKRRRCEWKAVPTCAGGSTCHWRSPVTSTRDSPVSRFMIVVLMCKLFEESWPADRISLP